MSYEAQLIAAGIPPEQAQRDAWADTMQMWRNRERYAYGKYAPDPPSAEEVRQAYRFKYED